MTVIISLIAALFLALNTFVYSYAKKKAHISIDPTTIVLLAECVKFSTSIVLHFFFPGKETNSHSGSSSSNTSVIHSSGYPPHHRYLPHHWQNIRRFYLYIWPAGLYAINNTFTFVAMKYMDPGTYQVMSNFKILTTALLAVYWYKQTLQSMQIIALIVLTVGGALCVATKDGEDLSLVGASTTGVVMVLIMCVISAIAGLSCEMIMKRDHAVSLHMQNIQMSLASLTVLVIQHFVTAIYNATDTATTATAATPFTFPTHALTWFNVVTQASVGMLIACVIKFQGTISKLFIQGAASVVSLGLTVYFFSATLTGRYVAGVVLVLISLPLYYIHQQLQPTVLAKSSLFRTLVFVFGFTCVIPLSSTPSVFVIQNMHLTGHHVANSTRFSNHLEALIHDPLFYESAAPPPEYGPLAKYYCANLNCTWSIDCLPDFGPQCCSWVNLKILLAWNHTAVKYNISYSLMFGTLLGAIRDRSIMPWTDDTDVMVSQKDFNRFSNYSQLLVDIHNDLGRQGFNFYHRGWTRMCISNNTEDPAIKPYVIPFNDTHIRAPYMDIFPPNHKWKQCNSSTLPTTRRALINSFPFPIFEQSEECLRLWYTDNWIHPHVRFQGGGSWRRRSNNTVVVVKV
eukprot:c9593_g1_i1.p1 GENE.c9593_g1_i1~~c9593_g1_i1.p1  ORF type:complete len:626 (+),score=119.87 c9593_g1_i1:88-1965(+)